MEFELKNKKYKELFSTEPLDKNKSNKIYNDSFKRFINKYDWLEDVDVYEYFKILSLDEYELKDFKKTNLWTDSPIFIMDEYKKAFGENKKSIDEQIRIIEVSYQIFNYMKNNVTNKEFDKSFYSYYMYIYNFFTNKKITDAFNDAFKSLSDFKVNKYWVILYLLYNYFNYLSLIFTYITIDFHQNIKLFLNEYNKKFKYTGPKFIEDTSSFDTIIKSYGDMILKTENKDFTLINDFKWENSENIKFSKMQWNFRTIPVHNTENFIKLTYELILKNKKSNPILLPLKLDDVHGSVDKYIKLSKEKSNESYEDSLKNKEINNKEIIITKALKNTKKGAIRLLEKEPLFVAQSIIAAVNGIVS